MKTEVYSWRVSADRKAALEEEARREGTTVSALLDRVTGDWLAHRRNGHSHDDAEQAALRKRVMKTVGTIRSGDPALASRAREVIREEILRKHLQESNASRRTD
ncbi:MAG TPA: hypothetical protein VI386_13755 [Candidatus Sulfotelmatobacter sp.]